MADTVAVGSFHYQSRNRKAPDMIRAGFVIDAQAIRQFGDREFGAIGKELEYLDTAVV